MDAEHGTTHDTGAELAKEEQGTTQPQQEKPQEQGTQKSVPYERFQQINERRKEAEKALDDVVQSLIDEVPEGMRSLVPNLPAAQRILWLKDAKKAGIFDTQSVPTQSPDSHRPQSKPSFDMNNASPFSMMANGYK